MSRTCSWCPTPSWSAASSRPSASACRPVGPSRRGSRQRRPVWPDIEVNANTFKPECSQLKRINLFLILPPCFSRSVIFWKAKLPSGRFFWRFVLKTWPLCFCHFTKNSIGRSFLSSSWKFSNFRSVCFWWNGNQDGNIFRRNLEKKHFLSFPTVCFGTILFRAKVLKNDVETFFSVIFCSTRIETSSFRLQLIFLNATQLQKTRIKSESDFLVTNWALLWKQWYLVGLTLQALEWRLEVSAWRTCGQL